MISCLLFGGVPLTFFNFVMTFLSMFNFLTKLSDMMEKRFLTILYGWTGAILDGTHKYRMACNLSSKDFDSYSSPVKTGVRFETSTVHD